MLGKEKPINPARESVKTQKSEKIKRKKEQWAEKPSKNAERKSTMAKKIVRTRWKVASAATRSIPMNLQLFAEPGGPGGNDPATGGEGGGEPGGGEGGVTLESLMAEIETIKAENATLKADNAKLKTDKDKLCQSEGQLRKQLRDKMSAEEEAAEAEAEEKAKHNEYVAGLEKKLAIIESTARFMEMGFDADMAAATANADFEGDKETVNANIKKMMAAQRKQMEAELRDKLLKDIPAPQSGNQSDVDYAKQINDAIGALDMRSAALAILNQAQAQGQTK